MIDACRANLFEKSRLELKSSTNVEFSRKLENWVPGEELLAYAFPMRKTEVPQFGQTPLTAGLPFLSVTFSGL